MISKLGHLGISSLPIGSFQYLPDPLMQRFLLTKHQHRADGVARQCMFEGKLVCRFLHDQMSVYQLFQGSQKLLFILNCDFLQESEIKSLPNHRSMDQDSSSRLSKLFDSSLNHPLNAARNV